MSDVPPTLADEGDLTGDLTRGPIARTLVVFALPTLASNILQSLRVLPVGRAMPTM